jgi:tetratricopeptide (TPR) repeat protein
MTVLRFACVLLLILPIACSGTHVNSHPSSPEEEIEDGPDPTDADGYVARGNDFADRGEYEKAIADYQEAIRLAPTEDEAYTALAWLLATCPEDRVRDGKKAVELATKGCELSGWKDADALSTLAAAHAECGEFEEAVKWQKKALKIGFDREEETEDAREQLRLYQERKPYREK